MIAAVTLKHRPDIDGLRAIAVLPVVLFHFQIPPFSGGYVGVDVFFVISGYLITGMILPEIEGRRFSLVTFYERRVRRIFPALFAVLIVCVLCGELLLLPNGLKDLSQSVAAATLFASNFLFWHKSGYFDAPAHVPVVVLVARFSTYALGSDKDDIVEGSVQHYLSDVRAEGSPRAASKQVFQRGIERTLLRLAKGDRAVWIVQEVPNLSLMGRRRWRALRSPIATRGFSS